MLKKLIISIAILFSTTAIFAMPKANIQAEMTNKIDKVLIILKDSKLNTKQKGEEIIQIMDALFDYSLMARLSAGKNWKKITKAQRTEFTELFTKKIKDSYVEKLDLYTDELVKFLGTEENKKNRITLKTQLIGKDAKHDINYKFYKKKKEDNWLIYDVDLVGVSIIQTYRKQISGFLKDKTFEELLTHVKNQNKNQIKK